MAKIKITDLPCDMKISKEEMKKVFGGATNEDLSIQYVTPEDLTNQYMSGEDLLKSPNSINGKVYERTFNPTGGIIRK